MGRRVSPMSNHRCWWKDGRRFPKMHTQVLLAATSAGCDGGVRAQLAPHGARGCSRSTPQAPRQAAGAGGEAAERVVTRGGSAASAPHVQQVRMSGSVGKEDLCHIVCTHYFPRAMKRWISAGHGVRRAIADTKLLPPTRTAGPKSSNPSKQPVLPTCEPPAPAHARERPEHLSCKSIGYLLACLAPLAFGSGGEPVARSAARSASPSPPY